MYPRIKPLAVLLPLTFVSVAQAAELYAALDPLLVTATRQQMRASEQLSDVTVIEREELETCGQSTLEEVLARQPGIEFASNGSVGANTSIFTRGTNSKHTLLLIDGMRIGSATAGDAAWSRLPVGQIDRIEIVRGPASSLYGSDALGGVVQVFTRKGDGPLRFSGEVGAGSYDTYGANAGLSGAQGGWRYALNASSFKTMGINSKRNTTGADRDRDGYENASLTGSLAYSISKDAEVGGSFFYSDGENRYDAGGNDRNRQIVSSFNTYLKNRLTTAWTSTLSVGHSTDDSKNLGTYASLYKTDQDQYVWQNDLKTAYGNFLLGVERLEQKVESTTLYQVTERTNDSVQLGWTGRFSDHLLQASARYDDNSQFGDKTTGSVAYGYRFNSNWRANLGYGTAFRAPSFNDLYWPYADYGSWGSYQGNPNLKPEFAHNREASIHYEAGKQRVSLTWFLNKVENLIATSGDFNAMPINIGNARLEGATLAYEGALGDYTLQASASHQDPRNADNDRLLARRARNFGNAAIGRTMGPWEWRVEVQASGYRFDNASNSKKLDGYALANVYGAYHFARDWSVFARVNNVFDRDYTLADGYETPGVNAFVGIRYSPK